MKIARPPCERRSISAHAGEPPPPDRWWGRGAVYPRPRGGTKDVKDGAATLRGLSPPTRGNLGRRPPTPPLARSIPAHAGEPYALRPGEDARKVYPRPRGGTSLRSCAASARRGLSPPTRGNPTIQHVSRLSPRSIPAHAGEPSPRAAWTSGASVYPRPRGGSRRPAASSSWTAGLSPPTRGNPAFSLDLGELARSIPAHAGEPRWLAAERGCGGVYPRPRGGTRAARSRRSAASALSPPTRGNQIIAPKDVLEWRSIPAHAGEPTRPSHAKTKRGVYPRPRGGTPQRELVESAVQGLSPPTRGNLAVRRCIEPNGGSIPAHAGEPG